MSTPGIFGAKDRVFEKDLMTEDETRIATRDFIVFRDAFHKKLTDVIIAEFNELQIFLRDHMPKEQLTLNLLLATWRATTIDSVNTLINCGDYCEKEYIKSHNMREVSKN